MYEIKKWNHNNLPIIILFFFLMVAPLADDLPLTPHHEGIYHFPLSLSRGFLEKQLFTKGNQYFQIVKYVPFFLPDFSTLSKKVFMS